VLAGAVDAAGRAVAPERVRELYAGAPNVAAESADQWDSDIPIARM
jgi:hypothetical protein